MKIGRVTISDRAAAGQYADASGPEIERVLSEFLGPGHTFLPLIVPDEAPAIAAALRQLADHEKCELVVTTGGTGITPRDVTPEATRQVLDKELPGFGEIMRLHSYQKVRTAILSRAVAGTRGATLIINLPGKPRAVAECLSSLREAIIEAIEHLQGRDPHSPA
jgi:molybdopterin adenylyltransferase